MRRQGEEGSLGRRRASFILVTGEKQGKGGRSRRAERICAGQMGSSYVMASHFRMKYKTRPPARLEFEATRGIEIASVTSGLVRKIY